MNTMTDFGDYMFKIPLLHLQVRNWNVKKKNLLEIVNGSNLIVEQDNIKTDYHNQVGEYNDKISEILKEEIEIFCNYFKFNHCKMLGSWFEIAELGNDHVIHNHGPIGYSSVCYVDYNKDVHTPTQFISPFHNFLDGSVLHYEPKIEEGSIIFFPSAIMHYTKPNNSKIKRTILSFNLNVKSNEYKLT
jgi:hypothetical protein